MQSTIVLYLASLHFNHHCFVNCMYRIAVLLLHCIQYFFVSEQVRPDVCCKTYNPRTFGLVVTIPLRKLSVHVLNLMVLYIKYTSKVKTKKEPLIFINHHRLHDWKIYARIFWSWYHIGYIWRSKISRYEL